MILDVDNFEIIKETKRIGFNKEDRTISMYQIKSHMLRSILDSMEIIDLKNLCKFLKLKVSGTKKNLIERIWKSKKIKNIGFITS